MIPTDLRLITLLEFRKNFNPYGFCCEKRAFFPNFSLRNHNILHHSSATRTNIDKRTSSGQTRTIPEQNSENRKWIGQHTAAWEGARLWPPKFSDFGFSPTTSHTVWAQYKSTYGPDMVQVDLQKFKTRWQTPYWVLTRQEVKPAV